VRVQVVSFLLKGGHDSAALFIDSLQIPYIAPSLGGVESLVEQPSVISYWDKTPEQRKEYGIDDGLVRFSIGALYGGLVVFCRCCGTF
jgi:cystathionine gamma-synthase